MSYSIESTTDGCYPGTTVLKNKLDIRDEELLDEAEALMTYINGARLEKIHLPVNLTSLIIRRSIDSSFRNYMTGQGRFARLTSARKVLCFVQRQK